jgi:3-deoxy-7-phosphoheptulonate synthase
MRLPTPLEIKKEHPLRSPHTIDSFRKTAVAVLERRDPRLAVIVGPCSIHDPDSAYEYALRLKKLTEQIEPNFFPIMRVFIEKPRTKLGWKGMLYDPRLDGSNDIALGIRESRALLLKITELGIPCALELLEPLAIRYFDDLIVWGLIGARTCASQPHRQMASGLHFPVGFKNNVQGDIASAIDGILTAKMPHSYIGIDEEGYLIRTQTKGNPLTHLVLRGSSEAPNYDTASIQAAIQNLKVQRLEPRLIVDCSHGNCGKDHRRQSAVFHSIVEQASENKAIAGLMLESHLLAGKQPLSEDPNRLTYGMSITDPCIGWEETESLLKSIHFVQK